MLLFAILLFASTLGKVEDLPAPPLSVEDSEKHELGRGDWGYRCLDPIDKAKFGDVLNDLTDCGNAVTDMRGLRALGAFKRCISEKGFTPACTSCMGRFAFCSGLHCTYWCGHGGNGSFDRVGWFPPCQLCDLSCGKLLAECSGFGKLPQAMCRSHVKKEMYWMCDLILPMLPNGNYDGPGGYDPFAAAELGAQQEQDTNLGQIMAEFIKSVNKSYDQQTEGDSKIPIVLSDIGRTLDFLSAVTKSDLSDALDWAETVF